MQIGKWIGKQLGKILTGFPFAHELVEITLDKSTIHPSPIAFTHTPDVLGSCCWSEVPPAVITDVMAIAIPLNIEVTGMGIGMDQTLRVNVLMEKELQRVLFSGPVAE